MKYLFVLLVMLELHPSQAQEVLSSFGTTESTLGEVFITSLNSSAVSLTQGFHQPRISLFEVKAIEEYSIQAFPNPTSEFIRFKHDLSGIEVLLVDSKGARVQVRLIEDELNVSNLSQGNYSLRIMYENKVVYSSKILIQR